MFSRTWIISLLLAAGVVFFGMKAVRVWSDSERSLPAIGSRKTQSRPLEKKIVKRKVPPEGNYEVVVEKNLFWPDRLEHAKKEPKEKPKQKKRTPDKKLLRLLKATAKKISLYGVLLTDDEKKALIKSPTMRDARIRDKKKAVRGDVFKWVKVGDPVSRFTVKEITKTSVRLSAEGLNFDFVLYDGKKPKPRPSKERLSGPIVFGVKPGGETGEGSEKKGSAQVKSPQKKLPIKATQKSAASAGKRVGESNKR